MPNVKITELPAASAVTSDDLIPIVNAPSSAPETQRATAAMLANLFQASSQIALAFEDFIGAVVGEFQGSVSGTGASIVFNATATAQHPGIAQAQTGSTNSGLAGIGIGGSTGQAFIVFGGGAWLFETSIRIPVLSNGTDRFTVRAGFSDNRAADGTDGIYFRYVDNVNSGKFEAVCRANSVETASDTGITVAANTFYRLTIEVNAAATSVVFKVNGTTVATIATNIPSGTGRETGVCINIVKSVGTNSLNLDIDYALYRAEVSR